MNITQKLVYHYLKYYYMIALINYRHWNGTRTRLTVVPFFELSQNTKYSIFNDMLDNTLYTLSDHFIVNRVGNIIIPHSSRAKYFKQLSPPSTGVHNILTEVYETVKQGLMTLRSNILSGTDEICTKQYLCHFIVNSTTTMECTCDY